jgi:hypothetical protein
MGVPLCLLLLRHPMFGRATTQHLHAMPSINLQLFFCESAELKLSPFAVVDALGRATDRPQYRHDNIDALLRRARNLPYTHTPIDRESLVVSPDIRTRRGEDEPAREKLFKVLTLGPCQRSRASPASVTVLSARATRYGGGR